MVVGVALGLGIFAVLALVFFLFMEVLTIFTGTGR